MLFRWRRLSCRAWNSKKIDISWTMAARTDFYEPPGFGEDITAGKLVLAPLEGICETTGPFLSVRLKSPGLAADTVEPPCLTLPFPVPGEISFPDPAPESQKALLAVSAITGMVNLNKPLGCDDEDDAVEPPCPAPLMGPCEGGFPRSGLRYSKIV